MRYTLLSILFLCCAVLTAQDRLFFNNGTVRSGTVVSVGKDVLYFKNTDTAAAQLIKKSDLLLFENYRGVRYLFGRDDSPGARMPGDRAGTAKRKHQNSLSVQPFGLFMGRATLRYEHISDDGKIGIAIPLSLSFNPYPQLQKVDTVIFTPKAGVNVIGGVDLNFYVGMDNGSQLFIGPRFRFGTDVLLFDTEGYSLQTQVGWKFEDEQGRLVQHLSVGFGFLKILSSSALIVNQRTFGCYSVNYAIGLKW